MRQRGRLTADSPVVDPVSGHYGIQETERGAESPVDKRRFLRPNLFARRA